MQLPTNDGTIHIDVVDKSNQLYVLSVTNNGEIVFKSSPFNILTFHFWIEKMIKTTYGIENYQAGYPVKEKTN